MFLAPFLLFAQEESSDDPYADFKKWHLEFGVGSGSNARAHDVGPIIVTNTPDPFAGIRASAGVRYNFTEAFGLRLRGAYNTFSADTDESTIDYTSSYIQATGEVVLNIGNMANFDNWTEKFNLQAYTGLGVGFLAYDTDVRDDSDNNIILTVGLTPMFKLSDNLSLFLDGQLTAVQGMERNWSGATPVTTRAVDGFVYNMSLGLSIALGKDRSEGSIDWYYGDDSDAYDEEIARLDKRVDDLDEKVNAIPVDEIGAVSDEIKNYVTNYIDNSKSDFNTVESLITDGYIRVFFDFDEDMPNVSSVDDISTLINFMNNNPDKSVELIGMTDVLGSESYNDDLSVRRAKSVSDILVAAGVDQSRIEHRGKGVNPVYNSKNEYIRMLARTVTVKLK